MNKQQARKYAQLDAKIKELEAQKKQLRISILAELDKNGITKEETLYGTFTVSKRSTWKYSDAITKMNEKVKIAQVKEQQKGIAKRVESETIVFTPVKA